MLVARRARAHRRAPAGPRSLVALPNKHYSYSTTTTTTTTATTVQFLFLRGRRAAYPRTFLLDFSSAWTCRSICASWVVLVLWRSTSFSTVTQVFSVPSYSRLFLRNKMLGIGNLIDLICDSVKHFWAVVLGNVILTARTSGWYYV